MRRRSTSGCSWSILPSPGWRSIPCRKRRRSGEMEPGSLTFYWWPQRGFHKNPTRLLMNFLSTWKMRNLQNIFTSSNRLTEEELSRLNITKMFQDWKMFSNATTFVSRLPQRRNKLNLIISNLNFNLNLIKKKDKSSVEYLIKSFLSETR